MNDSVAVTEDRRISLVFTGTGMEYFKIWIVNICLTIVTLGIYSAWAKVRRMRYFYGNTRLANHGFAYLADPVKILKGRIIAVGVLVIYSLSWDFFPQLGFWFMTALLLLLPFILVTAMSFNMRNSAYRNITFFFKRDYAGAYKMFAWPVAVTLVLTWLGFSLFESSDMLNQIEQADKTGEFDKMQMLPSVFMLCVMPFIPYLDFVRSRFIVNKTQYGKLPATFSTGVWSFYKIYLIAMLMFFVMGVCFGFGMAAFAAMFEQAPKKNDFGSIFVIMVIFYSFSFFVAGYMRAARTNLIFNHTAFGDNRLGCDMKSLKVGWLYLSNTIAIILSVGLLIPWAQVRMTRYIVECTTVDVTGLEEVVAMTPEELSSLGEEMVDAFDLDLGL